MGQPILAASRLSSRLLRVAAEYCPTVGYNLLGNMRVFSKLLLGIAIATAQEPDAPLRVSVTLVQVDAVVVDSAGRQVTDLDKEDFEVFEDGKPRTLTQFSYERAAALPAKSSAPNQRATTHKSPSIRREEVRRTVALLVDDLKMSFESVYHTKAALKKFVDGQMQPGDLVSIISTSGGISALQQFTTDKKLLHAAIDRIRFLLAGGGRGGAVKAIGGGGQEVDAADAARIRQTRFVVGTLGSLRHVVDGMRELPGRKSLVLFSDDVAISKNQKDDVAPTAGDILGIADRAKDAAVVVYGIDPKGLAVTALQAQDDTSNLEQVEVRDALYERSERLRDSQAGLTLLAARTGGQVHLNDNDPSEGLRRVLDDQAGYYLLGFEKGGDDAQRVNDDDAQRANANDKYRRILVKVKRPGLRVRHRRGYMGDGSSSSIAPRTPAERLMSALQSPFAGRDVELRLSPGFGITEDGQLAVQALIHVSGANLSFESTGADGARSAELHVVAVTEGDSPAGGMTRRTYTIRAKDDVLPRLREEGFVYELQHEVKKPGAYHLRVAVMDARSGRVGSSSRFVEVPALNKGALAMSNISMSEGDWRKALQAGTALPSDNSFARRIFRRQHAFSYGVTLYNTPLEKKSGRPGIEILPRLIRNDRVVWQGKPIAIVVQPGMDLRRIPAGGVLALGANTTLGEYVLELKAVVTATREEIVSQSLDFELR